MPDVITPFPGGIVRSGSKVGSKYKGAVASTNDAFCPTLRGRVKSELGPDTVAVLEIVIDGLTSKSVANAMKAGLKAVIDDGAAKGVTRVTAGNYGGKLGQHHYHAAGAAAMSGLTFRLNAAPAGAARPFAPDAASGCRRSRSPRSEARRRLDQERAHRRRRVRRLRQARRHA